MATLTIQPDPTAGKDTWLYEGVPTQNDGAGTALLVGHYNGTNGRCHGLDTFSLATLPVGATVTAATLGLYYYSKTHGGDSSTLLTPQTVVVSRHLRTDWVEAEATWNIYKAASNWSTAGCSNTTTDYTTANQVTSAPPATINNWHNISIPALVTDARAAGTDLHLRLSPSGNPDANYVDVRYYSSDYTTDTSKRPKLDITYGTTQTLAANITGASTVAAAMSVYKIFSAAINAASSVVAEMKRLVYTTLTKRVATGTDDAYYNSGAAAFSLTGDNHAGDATEGCGMRFTNLLIPRSATITAATVTFTAKAADGGGGTNTRFWGEDTDDAATFSTMLDFMARKDNATTAVVAWDSIPDWTANQTYTSPSLTTVVQEVVNRSGWTPGNDIVLFWNDWDARSTAGCHRKAYAYDESATNAPLLSVTYRVSLIDLAAAVLAESTVSAAMAIRKSFAAAVNGASTVSAAIGVKAVLAAVVNAASTVSAALSPRKGFAAVIAAVSTFTAKIVPWSTRRDTAATWTERSDTSATWTERTESGDSTWNERDVT